MAGRVREGTWHANRSMRGDPLMTDDQIIDAILRREAGYVDDPTDRGRCTNRGITQATLADWRGHPVTCEDVRNLGEQETRDIYRAKYLRPFDGADQGVKPQLVDMAVHHGVGRASILWSLAQQHSDKPLNTALVVERLKFMSRIVHDDHSQAKYISGWVNRAVEFL